MLKSIIGGEKSIIDSSLEKGREDLIERRWIVDVPTHVVDQ